MTTWDYYDASIKTPEMDPLCCPPQMEPDLYMQSMKPPMEETICLISPGVWSIGSLMMCEIVKNGNTLPADSICSWTDGETYCLRKRSPRRVDRELEGDFLAAKHIRGIWNISPNTYCKVKGWVQGFTTEATTIRWIKKNIPSIPTQEIIFDWIDEEWNRVITISKAVPGRTYNDVWPDLTIQQKLYVADEVASHLLALSKHTSNYVETVQGTGLAGIYSLREREPFPWWKPRVEQRVPKEDYEAFIRKKNECLGIKTPHPGIGEPYVLQHSDCNPSNILVSIPSSPDEMPKVTGIIDWEKIGFLPRWKIATNPRAERHFAILIDPWDEEHWDWQWMLSNSLVRAGFPLELEYAKECKKKTEYLQFPTIPIEVFVRCEHLLNEDEDEENEYKDVENEYKDDENEYNDEE